MYRLVVVELLKLKRTPALRFALLFPLVFSLLFLWLGLSSPETYLTEGKARVWRLVAWNTMGLWFALFYPFFLSILVLLVCNVGRDTKALVYTFPISRTNIFFSKAAVTMILVGFSFVIYFIAIGLLACVLAVVQPELPLLIYPPSLSLIFFGSIAPWFFSSTCVVILLLLYSYYNSLLLAFAIGIGATIATGLSIVGNWSFYYPWAMPFDTFSYVVLRHFNPHWDGGDATRMFNAWLYNTVGVALLLILGAWREETYETK